MNSTFAEKLGMLVLAGGATTGLIWLGLAAMHEHVDASAATLIGVIAGGLAASIKDIIAAIRGYSMSAQLSKVTDQLAASGPVPASAPPGASGTVDAAAAADQVADAAVSEADKIKGDA